MRFDEKRFAYEALIRWNYFPNQKIIGEIPPCFSTKNFTPEIAEILVKSGEPACRKGGYDNVEYLASRYNNIPRPLSLIHPRAYAYLAREIHENWNEIEYIKSNEKSMIKPEQHDDGRLLIMNYEDPEIRVVRSLTDGFACRFRVHTDISGCFHSIYTHSIPWAIIGFDASKEKLGSKGKPHWSDKIDMYQRKAKRNETQGIPIGPASSSIVAEIILGKVDEALLSFGFKFRRYIDDYTCFCETNENAEHFITVLGSELKKYKLHLN
ncbi:RNA-directed DNA polymerase [Janthinobacterium sp.]|uniref:RNA-directed DNA polymerase n=1 Tax=Janthinobacterium sp. TaxID=1871054 RepID=UPI00293D7C77|nr:RNA-directed DNA polymerase [Janthinobacterium sp.]